MKKLITILLCIATMGIVAQTNKKISQYDVKGVGEVEDGFYFVVADPGVENYRVSAVNLKADIVQKANLSLKLGTLTYFVNRGVVTLTYNTSPTYNVVFTIDSLITSSPVPLIKIYDSAGGEVTMPITRAYAAGTLTLTFHLGYALRSDETFYVKIIIL